VKLYKTAIIWSKYLKLLSKKVSKNLEEDC